MSVVPMRHDTDCEVAALATAAGVSWEKARDALGWHDLPGEVENPVFGNPENVRWAIELLGHKAVNRSYGDIVKGIAREGKTLALLHDPLSPTTRQHWVVLASSANGYTGFHMGDGTVKTFRNEQFLKLFTGGFPNAAFEVGEKRELSLFQRLYVWFQNLFRSR